MLALKMDVPQLCSVEAKYSHRHLHLSRQHLKTLSALVQTQPMLFSTLRSHFCPKSFRMVLAGGLEPIHRTHARLHLPAGETSSATKPPVTLKRTNRLRLKCMQPD